MKKKTREGRIWRRDRERRKMIIECQDEQKGKKKVRRQEARRIRYEKAIKKRRINIRESKRRL